jgi:hypothetical protein
MWKVLFLAVALAVSVSPLDAREPAKDGKKIEKTQRGEDLRRDVERISKEIYPPTQQQRRR